MSLYTRARRHIDMNRVKELHEEKIKRKKIAEEIREQIREELRNLNSPEFSNWRYDIDESMTTSDVFSTTLPAQGDVDLEDINNNGSSLGSNPDFSQNGNNYTFGSVTNPGPRGSSISMNSIDSTKYDTISFDFSGGTIDTFYVVTGSPTSSTYNLSTGSGRKTITLNAGDRKSGLVFALHVERGGTDNLPVGTNRVTNLSFQRRTPMNVFVSLDSPEATAFIRTDPSMQGLSAEDRKKKLIDMLDAGDEYLLKYLGMTGSSARPSDTTMPGSWEQAATYGGKEAEDRKRIRDALNNPNDPLFLTPGQGQPGRGRGMGDRWFPSASTGGTDNQIAAAGVPRNTGGKSSGDPNNIQWPRDKYPNKKAPPGPGARVDFAHHEPEGEVLSEKKRLKESMTTSDVFSTTLPAEPDIIQDSLPSTTITSADNLGNPTADDIVPRIQSFQVTDSSKTDTITVTISGTFNTKTVDGDVIDDKISVGVLVGGTYVGNYLKQGLGNGTHTVSIPPRFQKAGVKFDAIQVTAFQGGSGAQSGTVNITGVGLKRVKPMNVFVSLDSPEATAFIRTDPTMQGLSAEERRKKLEDMLDAGNEYLLKYLGMIGSKARPSDTTMPDSWEQAAAPGPKGMDRKPGSYSPNNIIPIKTPGSKYKDGEGYEMIDPFKNSPATFPGLSKQGKNYGNVAATYKSPLNKQSGFKGVPKGTGWYPTDENGNPYNPQTGLPIKQAGKNQKTMVAHHEPKGETIMEKNKKTFKDLTKKIPGYYDGKPAPLGFPMQEPPKMKNGFHPDLVDGKKVSDRFNRLDPQSAKAMPPTGNPHIDKKVRAAAKKPK